MMVEAAGGKFIKWTGDGFLAWFETPLHRQLGERAAAVFRAAWHLTFLVNVTQLGLSPHKKFRIRHGVTYEPDALVTKISHPGGYESLDLAGRAVVLAFRLSGVAAEFPGISTQKELVDASRGYSDAADQFRKWKPSSDEKLKHFKGERWGTTSIYVSARVATRRPGSPTSLVRQAKAAIKAVEGEKVHSEASFEFAKRFLASMQAGPEWCAEVVNQYLTFVREQMFEPLKQIVPILERSKDVAK